MRTDYFKPLVSGQAGAATHATQLKTNGVAPEAAGKAGNIKALKSSPPVPPAPPPKKGSFANRHLPPNQNEFSYVAKNNHINSMVNTGDYSLEVKLRCFANLPKNLGGMGGVGGKIQESSNNNRLDCAADATQTQNEWVAWVAPEKSTSYQSGTLLEAPEGVTLLPDDRTFIKRCLLLLPATQRHPTLREYRQRFVAGMEAEPIAHRKENAGRYRANTWLLEATGSRHE